MTFGDITAQIAAGDGTNGTAGAWIDLPEALFPGALCNDPAVRLRSAVLAVGGIRACLDVKLSCLPLPTRSVSLPCVDIGDDTDSCEANEICGCIQHPECGWCGATATCTRMTPTVTASAGGTSLSTGYSTSNPVCSCSGQLVTAATDALGKCAPSTPPPMPTSPAPELPAPPASPPDFPPYVMPAWVNGIGLGPGTAPAGLAAQWMVWGLCTLCTILALACCTVEERRAQAKSQERTLYTHANSPPSAPASLHATEPVASPRVELATKPPQGSARSDPSLANDAFLSQLPVRIQYAAARAIEESGEDGAVARISWLAQPQMLPLIVRPTLLWLLMTAIQPILLLTYQPPIPLPTEAEGAAFGLLILPPAYTLAFYLLAVRHARGIVYVLTESSALELSLNRLYHLGWPSAVTEMGSCQEIRRTSYAQMMSRAPVVSERRMPLARSLMCVRSRIFDVTFASEASLAQPVSAGEARTGSIASRQLLGSSAARGLLRFPALNIHAQAALVHQLHTRLHASTSSEVEMGSIDVPRISGFSKSAARPLASVTTSAAQCAAPLAPGGSDGGAGPSLTERSDRSSTRERPPSDRRYQFPADRTPVSSAPPSDRAVPSARE